MSKHTSYTCDIKDCKEKASSVDLTLLNVVLNVEIVPTGNSDYSAYEDKTLQQSTVDLCKRHREIYESHIPLVRDRSGLTMRTPITIGNLEEISE